MALDVNAAGHDRYLDPTPSSHSEPTAVSRKVDPQVLDQMDLPTAVSHEMEHLLSKSDLDGSIDDAMNARLTPGIRHLPHPADAVLAAGGGWDQTGGRQ